MHTMWMTISLTSKPFSFILVAAHCVTLPSILDENSHRPASIFFLYSSRICQIDIFHYQICPRTKARVDQLIFMRQNTRHTRTHTRTDEWTTQNRTRNRLEKKNGPEKLWSVDCHLMRLWNGNMYNKINMYSIFVVTTHTHAHYKFIYSHEI